MVAFQLTIDCADRSRLARFWAEALGYEPQGPPDGFSSWPDFWLARGASEHKTLRRPPRTLQEGVRSPDVGPNHPDGTYEIAIDSLPPVGAATRHLATMPSVYELLEVDRTEMRCDPAHPDWLAVGPPTANGYWWAAAASTGVALGMAIIHLWPMRGLRFVSFCGRKRMV